MKEYNGWEVGLRLRNFRKSKGMTVDKLSEISMLSVSHIRQIEQGNRRITIDTLYRLMNALNTDANTVLSINPNPENSIDAAIRGLEPDKQNYLTGVFRYMISEISQSEQERL